MEEEKAGWFALIMFLLTCAVSVLCLFLMVLHAQTQRWGALGPNPP